jgi:hypothetical protein
MEKKFEIEFKKGGKFVVALLMDDAPKTCEAFLNVLPKEVRFRQARFAGEEFFFWPEMACEVENQVPPQWGDVSFNADPKWNAVCIYYGSTIRNTTPFNLFGKIVSGNLEELRKVGERVWIEGEETAHVKLVS